MICTRRVAPLPSLLVTTPGNFAVVMGRAVIPTVLDESGEPLFGNMYEYQCGRMDKVRSGDKLALVAAGNMLLNALDAYARLAAAGHRIALVSVSDWSDLHDDDLAMLGGFDDLVVLEDHNVKTGLGTTIGSALMVAGQTVRLTKLGVTGYAPSGKPADLYRMLGLDGESVAGKIKDLLR